MSVPARETPLFLYGLRNVVEAAARAAFDWIGRGRPEEADGTAVEAMRDALNRIPFGGTVVVGEGDKDPKYGFSRGERVGGRPDRDELDFALDPVEGISYLARGLTNAMAVLAAAPRGTILDPGPAFYMEKLVAPPVAKGALDPSWPVERKLETLATLLGKKTADLRIFVLEKGRHRGLIERIQATGARVAAFPAGDVGGALMATIPDSGIDALMGTGGVPEGLMSACAVRALGGEFLGRLDPQLMTERAAVGRAGLDTERWYRTEELVASRSTYFCATGITTGLLLEGVERTDAHHRVQTLMIAGETGERHLLTSWQPRKDGAPAAGIPARESRA